MILLGQLSLSLLTLQRLPILELQRLSLELQSLLKLQSKLQRLSLKLQRLKLKSLLQLKSLQCLQFQLALKMSL